ncbi:fibronectin type III domain-containing protein [Candidatus Saccharibacteria bacterium]|nr:fibronectin type III domain-containing protein [Candidatus Saccharibacteria bacterium]
MTKTKVKTTTMNNKASIRFIFMIVIALLTLVTIWNFQRSRVVNAACSNTGTAGRIEADFNAPASGSFVTWAEVNAPANSAITGGIEGQSCRTVSTVANSTWAWVPINQGNRVSLQDGAFYTLNITTSARGTQLRGIRLINNECNPNTDAKKCETEAVNPIINSAPVITNVRQTTSGSISPARLNFIANITDDRGISSVELFDSATKSAVGTMTKNGNTTEYSASIGPYGPGTHQFYVVAKDNGDPSLATASSVVTVKVDAPSAPIPDSTPVTVFQPGIYDDTVFNYVGGWSIGGSASGENKYNGSDYWTSAGDAVATIKFTGTGIVVYGAKASWHGIMSATLDGKHYNNIDQYSANRIDQVEQLRISGLENTEHTLVLKNTKTKNNSSSNTITAIDKVVVVGQSGSTPQTEPSSGIGGVAPVNKAPTGPIKLSASLSYNGWIGGCSPRTDCKIKLSWDKAQDDSGSISHYEVYNGSQKVSTSPIKTENFTINNVNVNSRYSFKVFAFDAQGLSSSGSPVATKSVECSRFLWTAYCTLK